MSQVIAKIDISTPTGRRIVRDLEKHKRTVEVEYPLPENISGGKTYSLDEVHKKSIKKLSDHYGVNMEELMKKEK